MSGTTVGLTSLKTPQEVSPRILPSEQNPQSDKILLLKTEIEQLEKQRDNLKIDIDRLVLERNKDFKQFASELNSLKRQKLAFIDQIRKVSKMLFSLEEFQKQGKTDFGQFFNERDDVLINFASAVSVRLADKSKKLDERLSDLINEENLVGEMVTYTTLGLESLSRALSDLGEAEKIAKIAQKEASVQKDEAIKILKIATDSRTRANRQLLESNEVLEKSNQREKEVDAYVKKITKQTDDRVKAIDLKSIEVLKKEKYCKDWESRLNHRQRKLDDKEATLKRTAARLGVI